MSLERVQAIEVSMAKHSRLSKDTGCVEWTGSLDGHGYGQVTYMKKPAKAHRVAWILAHGDIPAGMFVCHKCDNRSCVNSDHLFLGFARDNTRDMVMKGRHGNSAKTHCSAGHEFTEENTRIRPGGGRRCRACKRASSVKRYWANRERERERYAAHRSKNLERERRRALEYYYRKRAAKKSASQQPDALAQA